VGTFGQVLEQQGAFIPKHVGLEGQQAVLTHECCTQVGHCGSLVQSLVLLRGEWWTQVAGFSSQETLINVCIELGPLPSAVRAAGLCDSQVCIWGWGRYISKHNHFKTLQVGNAANLGGGGQ
jgi:hypothetical protein